MVRFTSSSSAGFNQGCLIVTLLPSHSCETNITPNLEFEG